MIPERDFRAGQRDRRLCVVPVLIFVFVALLVLLDDVLQVLFLRRGGGDLGPRLAGDADDQEAQGQHQAETHPEHEVKAEALWVRCGKTSQSNVVTDCCVA